MTQNEETPGGISRKENLPSEGSKSASNLTARISKYSRQKNRNEEMAGYLDQYRDKRKRSKKNTMAAKAFMRLKCCGNFLLFRQYYTIDELRLHHANFCKQFKICPLCATRRASKMIEAYMPKWEQLRLENPSWNWYMVTLTVKDGANLLERYEHLKAAHKVLQQRRRDYMAKGWGNTVWASIHAAVGAYEITIGKNSGEWHPHLHLVIAADEMPIEKDHRGEWRCPALEKEWEGITIDSKVVDVRPFDTESDAAKSFCEVFKYALKFSSMTVVDNWEAAVLLHRKQLIVSYGAFRGIIISESLTDEPIEDLPYIELLYKYIPGSGYNFVSESEPLRGEYEIEDSEEYEESDECI